MSVRPRRPASVRAVWTAPAARIDGTGSRSTDSAASLSDEHLGARLGRRDRVGRQPIERVAETGRARRCGPRSRRASARGGPRRRPSSEQAVEVGHDGSLQAKGARTARRPAEQRRPPSELDAEVHDDALALRVDGRVRDLGEGLAEVVGDRPVEATATAFWVVEPVAVSVVALPVVADGTAADAQPATPASSPIAASTVTPSRAGSARRGAAAGLAVAVADRGERPFRLVEVDAVVAGQQPEGQVVALRAT